jgi:MoxR-like ATPase
VLSLTRSAQALAAARGRTYVLPDDVKALAPAALAHRLVVSAQRRAGNPAAGRVVVDQILSEVPVPLGLAATA